MYSIDYDREDLELPSHWYPTLIEAKILENREEVNSSPTIENNPYERHSIIQEEENPTSYNIEEIFEAFTFNLYKEEVSQKRVHNEN